MHFLSCAHSVNVSHELIQCVLEIESCVSFSEADTQVYCTTGVRILYSRMNIVNKYGKKENMFC